MSSMDTTRVTVTLELTHSPDLELPARVAERIQDTLASMPGVGGVSVVCGDMGDLIWIPHGARSLALEQLVEGERRVSAAERSRAEAAEAARAGAEAARTDAEASRASAERRAEDAAAELRDLRARVQVAEEARAAAEAALSELGDGRPRGGGRSARRPS
jgi:multidrug efflux pump subunit AcrB